MIVWMVNILTAWHQSCVSVWCRTGGNGLWCDVNLCSVMSLICGCCCVAVSQWVVVYRGPQREHVCKDLKAATQYSLRISAESAGGQSQVSVRNIRNRGLGLNDGDLLLNYLLLHGGGGLYCECVCVFVPAVHRQSGGLHSQSAPWSLSHPRCTGQRQTPRSHLTLG